MYYPPTQCYSSTFLKKSNIYPFFLNTYKCRYLQLDQTNQEARNIYSASKHATQIVGVASSQPVTCIAFLYSNQNALQFTSSANPSKLL